MADKWHAKMTKQGDRQGWGAFRNNEKKPQQMFSDKFKAQDFVDRMNGKTPAKRTGVWMNVSRYA